MLKIKDNVNLKELKRFGFEFEEEDNRWFYYGFTRPSCDSEIRIYIRCDTRIINTYFDMNVNHELLHDKIYVLINEGLVEMVGNYL